MVLGYRTKAWNREGNVGKSYKKEKEKVPCVPKPEVQPWQAQRSELLYVVNVTPGLAKQNHLAWEACMVDDAALSNSTKGGND